MHSQSCDCGSFRQVDQAVKSSYWRREKATNATPLHPIWHKEARKLTMKHRLIQYLRHDICPFVEQISILSRWDSTEHPPPPIPQAILSSYGCESLSCGRPAIYSLTPEIPARFDPGLKQSTLTVNPNPQGPTTPQPHNTQGLWLLPCQLMCCRYVCARTLFLEQQLPE